MRKNIVYITNTSINNGSEDLCSHATAAHVGLHPNTFESSKKGVASEDRTVTIIESKRNEDMNRIDELTHDGTPISGRNQSALFMSTTSAPQKKRSTTLDNKTIERFRLAEISHVLGHSCPVFKHVSSTVWTSGKYTFSFNSPRGIKLIRVRRTNDNGDHYDMYVELAGITDIAKKFVAEGQDDIGRVEQIFHVRTSNSYTTFIIGEHAAMVVGGFSTGYSGEGVRGMQWLLDRFGMQYRQSEIYARNGEPATLSWRVGCNAAKFDVTKIIESINS